MNTLNVDLGTRSYPIYIGADLLTDNKLLAPHIKGKQVLIISNDSVAPLYMPKLMSCLKEYEAHTVILEDGEQYKNLVSFERIIRILLEKRFSRNCTLIALGGGVIGDITGFVAASYQRGVAFIQIPTTLLAQVDSSVGGKTAVNHELGKNMIGAFYQPKAVIADINVLKTLEKRQLKAGIAEVIKYGLIRDKAFYCWLFENMEHVIRLNEESLMFAVERSCLNKADIVSQDEKESGIRAILNLGHTFGHAIETAMHYKEWLHGEAIGVGMLMAARMSEKLASIRFSEVPQVRAVLEKADLPLNLPAAISAERVSELMAVDKKSKDGKVSLILLKQIGQAIISDNYTHDILLETLREFENE